MTSYIKSDKIIKNSIKCKNCEDILVSVYEDILIECSCKSVAIKGGTTVLIRPRGIPDIDYIELSEYLLLEKNS